MLSVGLHRKGQTMAKRGRQQEDGLRFHNPSGRYYRLYDGKRKYFSPRGTDPDDREAKIQAERKWHAYEMDHTAIPAYVPRLGMDAARDELLAILGTPPPVELTDELVGYWRSLSMNAGPEQRQAFLATLGVETHEMTPQFLDGLTTGEKVNPRLAPDQRRVAVSNLLGTTPAHAITIQDVVGYYCDFVRKHRSDSHYADVVNRLPHFVEFIGGKETRLDALTKDHFIQYRDLVWSKITARQEWAAKQPQPLTTAQKRKGPGWSPDYGNKHLILVGGAFKRYAKDKDLNGYPYREWIASLEQRSAATSVDIPILKADELAEMLKHASPLLKTAITLGLNMAGSNEDINGIQWHNIAWEHDEGPHIEFPRGKNNRPRRIPLWQQTIDQLKAYQQETGRTEGRIFLTSHGTPLISQRLGKTGKVNKNDNLSQAFGKLMRQLDMPHAFRTIRKTTATLAKKYSDDGTVSMILGDAPVKMWKRYTMAVPDVVKNAIEQVGRDLFPTKTNGKKQTTKRKPKKGGK